MNKPNLPRRANPCCGYQTDTANAVESLIEDVPSPLPKMGDFSICLNCGTILVYVDPAANIQRAATPLDLTFLPPEILDQLVAAKKAVHDLHKSFPKRFKS
jgi:hypothetical protein